MTILFHGKEGFRCNTTHAYKQTGSVPYIEITGLTEIEITGLNEIEIPG